MGDSLNPLVDKLVEELEDNWFDAPHGWLYMATFPPSHKTGVEECSSSHTHQKMYFRPSLEKVHFLAFSEDNLGKSVESGHIDMSCITDVRMSESPEFALTLKSDDMNYSLVAEDQASMVRWALAINSCRPQQLSAVVSMAAQNIDDAYYKTENNKTLSRYEHTYGTKGPLGLNLRARTEYDETGSGAVLLRPVGVVVASFYLFDDGKPDRSEMLGIISVNDHILAVNGVDVTNMIYNEACDIIEEATFPKTVLFMRDSGDKVTSRMAGWAMVYHQSLHKYSRRYIDIRWDSIYFRRPLSGCILGARNYASIGLDRIDIMKPIIDKTMPKNRQFIVRLFLKAGAAMDYFDDGYNSPTSTSTSTSNCVGYIDICFGIIKQMDKWRSAFTSPNICSKIIPMQSLEIVESDVVYLTEHGTTNSMLCILSNKYVKKDFILYSGLLIWYKVGSDFPYAYKRRGIELYRYNSSHSNLRSVRAVRSNFTRDNKYKYQLELTTHDQLVTIVFEKKIVLLKWLKSIKVHVENNPVKGMKKIYFSDGTEVGSKSSKICITHYSDIEPLKSTIRPGTKYGAQGYLYMKRKKLSDMNKPYDKYFFVLHEDKLIWYANHNEYARKSSNDEHSLGTFFFGESSMVRESLEISATEFSIDVITDFTSITLAAVEEAEYILWLDALTECVSNLADSSDDAATEVLTRAPFFSIYSCDRETPGEYSKRLANSRRSTIYQVKKNSFKGMKRGSKLLINEISDDSNVENLKSTIRPGTKYCAQGYLYMKREIVHSIKIPYDKYFFVLCEDRLIWYTSHSEYVEKNLNGEPSLGTFFLRDFSNVRESLEISATEFSIDVITDFTSITLAAVDGADFNLWLDALAECISTRKTISKHRISRTIRKNVITGVAVCLILSLFCYEMYESNYSSERGKEIAIDKNK